MSFGLIIKRARIAQKLRQADVARLVGVHQATWSLWECEDGYPSDTSAKKIAQALELDEGEILKSLKVAKASVVKRCRDSLGMRKIVVPNNDCNQRSNSVLVRVCEAVGKVSPADFEISDLEEILAQVNSIESTIKAPLTVAQIASLLTAKINTSNQEKDE